MIETVFIDADIVTYRCAAATANEDVNIARWQTGEMMNRIIHETNARDFVCFLSGSTNFRYDIFPEYKANRKDAPRPAHYAAVREYLCEHWNATVTDGIEGDDAMGIAQHTSNQVNGYVTCIASIDKDMLMIEGHHYNFVKGEHTLVSPLRGLRNFYTQLILGDKTDNIPGFDGKMRPKVPNFLKPHIEALEDMGTEQEMFDYIREMYNNDDKLILSGSCLWIQRREGEIWPYENLMKGSGQKDDSIPLSQASYEVEAESGLPNTKP